MGRNARHCDRGIRIRKSMFELLARQCGDWSSFSRRVGMTRDGVRVLYTRGTTTYWTLDEIATQFNLNPEDLMEEEWQATTS